MCRVAPWADNVIWCDPWCVPPRYCPLSWPWRGVPAEVRKTTPAAHAPQDPELLRLPLKQSVLAVPNLLRPNLQPKRHPPILGMMKTHPLAMPESPLSRVLPQHFDGAMSTNTLGSGLILVTIMGGLCACPPARQARPDLPPPVYEPARPFALPSASPAPASAPSQQRDEYDDLPPMPTGPSSTPAPAPSASPPKK